MASWLERLLPRRKSSDGTLELWREVFGHVQSMAGKTVTLDRALQVSTVLACARVIAEGLAMLPWKVYRQAGRQTAPDPAHPLYERLALRPNPLQTAFEFVETLALHLAMCGNAYVWVLRVSGRVDELWLLEPSWVRVKAKFGEMPTYEVRSPNDDVRTTLTPDELWHIRGPSWISYLGLEPVKMARDAIGLAMAMEQAQSSLHARGVTVPGVLSVEGTLQKDQYDKLRDWLKKEHEGAANAGVPMILDRNAKWMQTALSGEQAQTLESRRLQVEEICRHFRVMPIMVGHADKVATYASAEQMFIAHSVHTLGPWVRRLELSADMNLLTPDDRAAGFYTKMNEKALQRMTAKDQMEVLTKACSFGILTRNEGREVLDRNPIDGLDEPLTPANTTVGAEPPSDPTPNDPPNPDPASGDPSPTPSQE